MHAGFRRLSVLLHLVLGLTSLQFGAPSLGDRLPIYQTCVHDCQARGCVGVHPAPAKACRTICLGYTSIWLRLFKWSCQSDCQYLCMRAVEESRRRWKLSCLKYHGKWPLIRILGMQEFVSVAMSLLNLAAHIVGIMRMERAVVRLHTKYPFHGVWKLYGLMHCIAWLSSATFHSRDTLVTERADYVAAFSVIIASCATAAIRLVPFRWKSVRAVLLVGLVCVWLMHMHYMTSVVFNYGWNMTLCLALGFLQSIAWVVWAQATKHPGRVKVHSFVALVASASLLEVLDFPPIFGLVDAHALWHTATALLTGIWYSFIVDDVAMMASSPKARRHM